jgi:hypothetical protein
MALYDALTAAAITRVAIVDDDSGELTFESLPEELRDILGDPDDPRFTALLHFALAHGDIPEGAALGTDEMLALVRSQTFIRSLCREELAIDLAELHEQYMRPVLLEHNKRRAPVTALKKILREVGYSEDSISVYGANVSAPQLFDCSLVFVDLMLDPQSGSSQHAQSLISSLTTLCRERNRATPLLVLMSINQVMLRENRQRIRVGAEVSASGFRIIPKTWLTGEGAQQRVELVLTQLLRERPAVAEFGRFVGVWKDAVTAARDAFVERLWALDMRCLQLLDDVARQEGMALEDHVGDVLMRYLLWHVETQPLLQPAMSSINRNLRQLLDGANAPTLLQDMFETDQIEALNRSATWHAREWLRDVSPFVAGGDAILWLKRHLSFGDVLVSSAFPQMPRVFVHLTQACDFARIDSDSAQRLLFLEGEARLESSEKTVEDRGSLVSVRGCRIMDQTYILRLDLRRVQMLSPSLASKLLARKRYRVTGRMRSDAAQRLLNQYAQHISRVAMPGETSVRSIAARMLRKDGTTWSIYSDAGEPVSFAGALTLHTDDRQLYFFELSVSELAAAAAPGVQVFEGTRAPPAPLTWLEYLVACFRNGVKLTGGGTGKPVETKAIVVLPETDETLADAVKWAKNRGERVILLYRPTDSAV